jgi:N-hydroxyarylamine O-acetyltransferase
MRWVSGLASGSHDLASSQCHNRGVDVAAYLDLLGLERPTTLDVGYLERLQRAHMTKIPFENLDVFARRGVRTDDAWAVAKVIDRQRGGWCFELNGAFAALLDELGYDVSRRAATVFFSQAQDLPSHLTLVVTLEGKRYLVDVGFGDSFIRPLRLDAPGPHDGGSGTFGFVFDSGQTTLVAYDDHGEAEGQYRFDGISRRSADFDEASTLLQTQPGLQWTKSRFATRLIDGGPDRVTLLEDRIKFRHNDEWTEEPVAASEWEELLARWFALTP